MDSENIIELSEDFTVDNDESGDISQSEILELVQNLPEGYKIVFNLYVFEKYSHSDIAQELNVSISTSKTQLFKARKLLQKGITELMNIKEKELSVVYE